MGLFSATQIGVEEVEADFRPILVQGERVLAAFRTTRDLVFLTNARLCLVNKQGLTGRKLDVESIPYKSITRWAVETAGTFDLDADLRVWVSGAAQPLEIKVGRGSDTAGIQRILSQGVMGGRAS